MQRGLVLLLGGELLTTSSAMAVQTALGWEGYARSGDPLVLGLIGLAEFVPALLFALPAGHAADHRDRRLVTVFGLGVIALATAGIAFDTAAGDAPRVAALRARPLHRHRSVLRLAGLSARCWPRASRPRSCRA